MTPSPYLAPEFLLPILVYALLGAVCFPYAINAWLRFFGREGRVRWWQGLLIGLCPFIGTLSVPLAVLTFIILLFIS